MMKNSRLQIFFEISVLKNFSIFTGKYMCWGLFLKKETIKKSLQRRCFPVSIAKFLRTEHHQ